MSLYQCEHCGAVENTALACQGCQGYAETFFMWDGLEDRKGKMLCSECAPSKYTSGDPSGYGKWHSKFEKIFLPMNQFKTNDKGTLEHIETGSTDFQSFALT